MGNQRWEFKAVSHHGCWIPMGILIAKKELGEDDEVWVDGCCIQDKQLVEKIALNMQAAYEKGFEDAIRSIVGYSIKINEENLGNLRIEQSYH